MVLTYERNMVKQTLIKVFFIISICRHECYEFPKNFIFGVGTSSYQVEGAWNISDKSENIWDYNLHRNDSYIFDKSNGDIATNSYYKTETDVALLKELSVHFYRFSLSWSRLLPSGFINYINPDAIRYYNDLIDTLLANGIEPYVTIFHWDLPQSLQDLGGWTNPLMVDYYYAYARKCFELFGDRVKLWITMNEPRQICEFGYSQGKFAPFYEYDGIANYLCAKTILIAHAKAYRAYDQEFRAIQKGRIGITIETSWFQPRNTSSQNDFEASERRLQFNFGAYAHPIFSKSGDWPQVMIHNIYRNSRFEGFSRSRLPSFTEDEKTMLLGSSDFLGLNHYTTFECWEPHTEEIPMRPAYDADINALCESNANAEVTASNYFLVTPEGIFNILKWLDNEYIHPEIFIVENGYAGFTTDGLHDCRRIYFYNAYLEYLLKAMYEANVNVIGFTAWSFLDNFEWTMGYAVRFGLYEVDFNDPERKRSPKMSSHVYRRIIETGKIDWKFTPENFEMCSF